jgi:protein-tyrosine phosphatase
MAERLMRRHLVLRLGYKASSFPVTSAGTWGCTGAAVEPFAALALESRGIDASDFAARELTREMLAEADLILTATTEHRGLVVALLPSAVRRTFTLKEFARLGPLMPTSDDGSGLPTLAKARVEVAGRVRGLGDRPASPEDDIEDPLGAPATFYEARAQEIDRASFRAVELLLGPAH